MTDAGPGAEFLGALPVALRRWWGDAEDLDGWVTLALANGWSIRDLARICSAELRRTFNASHVVKARLHKFAQQRPPERHVASFVQPKPPCGLPGCDPETRWFTDLESGRLVGHCPECWVEPSSGGARG